MINPKRDFSMRVVLNGKEVKNVTVMNNVDSKIIPFTIVTTRGKTFSLVRNRNNPNLLGVVNHGSLNYHKFRGYEWFTDSAEGTLLGLTGAY